MIVGAPAASSPKLKSLAAALHTVIAPTVTRRDHQAFDSLNVAGCVSFGWAIVTP